MSACLLPNPFDESLDPAVLESVGAAQEPEGIGIGEPGRRKAHQATGRNIGIDEHMYHLGATWLGTFAAVLTVVGLTILIYRRRRTRSVFLATTRMDKLMFVALGAAIGFGTAATVVEQIIGGGYNYRETISPWIRSVMYFQPDIALMDGIPVLFTLHVVSGLLLIALWPFTRLVHVWSAPVGYLVRPYIVYRSRDAQQGMREGRPGWDPVEARSRKR